MKKSTPFGRVVWALALLLLVSACDAGGGDDGPPAFADWTVNDGLRMGDLEHPDYSFGSVGAIAVAPDGAFYTAHPQEQQIRVWTRSGEPIRILGGAGEGPGEFMGLGEIGFAGDRLWAMDGRLNRVTWFDLDGELIDTESFTRERGATADDPAMGPAYPTHRLADGTFFGRQSGVLPQVMDRDSTLTRYLHLDDQSAVLHSLVTYGFRRRDGMAVPSPTGSGWLYGYQSFADAPLVAVSPARGEALLVERPVYTGEGRATYRLTRLSMSGDTVLQREVEYEPLPVGQDVVERVVDALVAQWGNQLRDSGVDESTLQELARGALFVPEFYPPISAAGLGEDGSIWVRDAYSETGRIPWKVFDAEGLPVAQVPVSTSFQFRVGWRDELWGVTTDNRGVPYVARYEVGPEE